MKKKKNKIENMNDGVGQLLAQLYLVKNDSKIHRDNRIRKDEAVPHAVTNKMCANPMVRWLRA